MQKRTKTIPFCSLFLAIITIGSTALAQEPIIEWIVRDTKNPASLYCIDVDSRGNVSFTGPGGIGILTARYDSEGKEQWHSGFECNDTFCDPSDIEVDEQGNTVVIGTDSYGSTSFPVLLKYDSLGVQQWSSPLEGGGGPGLRVKVDTNGYVYSLSYYNTDYAGGSNYTLVRKFDSNGNLQWDTSFPNSFPWDMAVDGIGSIYVAGRTWEIDYPPTDYLVLKFSPSGNVLWARTYDAASSDDDFATDIALDDAGNVYVTGTFNDYQNYGTIKYDAQGVQQWVAIYNGSTGLEYPADVAVDRYGSVYVTGTSENDFATVKYSPDGVEEWVVRFSGTAGFNNVSGMVIDQEDNIYVTGSSNNLGTGSDFCTIGYNTSGEQQWVAVYDGGLGTDDYSSDIDIDGNGSVYVAGTTGWVPTIIKYVQYPNQPTPVSPPPNAVVTSDSVVLVWLAQDIFQVDRYWLEVDADSLFGSPFIDSLVVDTTYALSSLNHLTNYWWRVKAHNDFGWGKFSQPRSFLAFQEIPAPPTLVSPLNGANDVPFSTSLDWNPSQGSDSYAVQLSDTSDFSTLIVDADSLSETTTEVVWLTGLTTYFWRVSASNTLGTSEWSEQWSFRTAIAQPALAFPSDGAVDLPPELSVGWYPVGGVPVDTLFYHLQLSLDDLFSETIVDDSTIVDTMRSIGPLDSTMTYYWRVRAKDELSTGPWSDVWSFQTLSAVLPSMVILDSPENGSITSELEATCSWRPGYPGVDAYWFEWADDSLFVESSIDSTGTDTLGVAMPLRYGKTYWWRVRAHNNIGWGPFSETWSFVVLVAGIDNENEIPSVYSLSQNYPNPFNPSTVIRYGLPSQTHVRLELFNMLGQRVTSLVDEAQDPGYHEVTFERAALSSGIYLYRLTAGNFVQTRKLILLR